MASRAANCFFLRLFKLWEGDHSCEKLSRKNGKDKCLLLEFTGDSSVNYNYFDEDCFLWHLPPSPRSRLDFSTSISFFLASIWWQMKTEGWKHLPVCYRYGNIVLHNYSSIFILSQYITFNKQQVTDFIPYQSSCCREVFRHFSEQSACSDIPDLQWFVFKYYS